MAFAFAVAEITVVIDLPKKAKLKTSTSAVLEHFVYTERNLPNSLYPLAIADEAYATNTSVAPQIELVETPYN